MAERRMFAKTIIDSDAFLDMPITARLLYYDLAMRADDDGFVNSPKKIMRIVGAAQDDLKLLALKKFIIPFDNGVVVIKHWRIHNYIRKDTYTETNYKEQKAMLMLDENKAYRFVDDTLTDSGRVEDTGKDRIGKDSIDKDNLSNTNVLDCPTKSDLNNKKYAYERETMLWNELKSLGIAPIRGISPDSERAKHLKARFNQYGADSFVEIIEAIKESDFLQGKHNGRPWQVTFDWVILPSNYPKVLEGNYKNKGSNKTGSAFDNIDIGD
jgi:hypothetical protein